MGVAHSFLSLTELTEVQYKVSDFWKLASKRTLRLDNPEVMIGWPLERAGVGAMLAARNRGTALLVELNAVGELF